MKVAVFSDIHGNYQALESILEDVNSKNVDTIIYLGDAVCLGPDSLACLEKLYTKNITFINGNHELYLTRGTEIDSDMGIDEIEHHKWVKESLNDCSIKDNNLEYTFTFNSKKYAFFHFFIDDIKKEYPFYHLDILKTNEYKKIYSEVDADYIFYGHNHNERYDEINNKKFYGVGSSGCVKNNFTYYYLIDFDNEKIEKINIKFDREKFDKRLNELVYPDKENIIKIFFN